MKLSVVIPTYNRLEKLKFCLRHLEKQTLPKEDFEVVVVDDGSTDNTHAFLADYKEKAPFAFTFFVQKNGGAGVARNKGVQLACGNIILFLGDDIYATPALLEEHLELHHEHPEQNAACLGFVTWDPKLEVTPLMRFMEQGKAVLGRFGGGQFAYDLLKGSDTASWNFFYTANISLKKSLLEKHPFDESFKGYGWEDIDLGLRLHTKEKLTLYYSPYAVAHHDHPQTLESFTKREHQVGRALPFFQSKHPDHKLLPSPLKKIVFRLISLPILLPVWRLFWPNMHYYATAKRHFLKGLRAGILEQSKKSK